MKRSEMIQLLQEAAEHAEFYNYYFGGEEIIEIIEKAGMLPPSTDYFIKNHPEQMHWEEVADYHNWEPEDE